MNSGDKEDNFMRQMTKNLEDFEKMTDQSSQMHSTLQAEHKAAFEMFGLTEGSDLIKEDPEAFLNVFISFFKNAVEALPKE